MGEGKIYNLAQIIAEYTELPEDIILNLPKVTLVGNIYAVVENHLGIIEYTDVKVRINTRIGEYIIHGKNLRIKAIYCDAIVVDGQINSIEIV